MAGVGFSPAPALADGFGWYAYLFNYDDFLREYPAHFARAAKGPDLGEVMPEFRAGVAGSAFELLGLMEESGKVRLIEPKSTGEDLLWAEAMREFGRQMQRADPRSPGRFLATGRQFRGLDDMPACHATYWLHGACGSAVLYKPDEVVQLLKDLDGLVVAGVKWSQPDMRAEFKRLQHLVREAAAGRYALFFYGHD